jgi:hypothetical protein
MSVSKVGPTTKPSALAAPPQDAEFERELFQLMGQLEQILVRLDAVSSSKRLPGSIEIAKEILVELVEFAEPRFKKESLTGIIGQVCDFHEQTKQFERLLGGPSWNGIAAFIGIKMSYSDEVKTMFQRLGRDLIEIVGGFFQLFEARFHSRAQASEWQASSQVFVDDVIRRWNADSRVRSNH